MADMNRYGQRTKNTQITTCIDLPRNDARVLKRFDRFVHRETFCNSAQIDLDGPVKPNPLIGQEVDRTLIHLVTLVSPARISFWQVVPSEQLRRNSDIKHPTRVFVQSLRREQHLKSPGTDRDRSPYRETIEPCHITFRFVKAHQTLHSFDSSKG